MNREQLSDAYWTVRIASYALAVGITGLVISLFWIRPSLGYSLMALFSGALVFLFHLLRWRTGRAIFQFAAMASAFVPLFMLIRHVHFTHGLQYVAIFMVSYALAVSLFRHRVLGGLRQDR
jgi:hypothetical protein